MTIEFNHPRKGASTLTINGESWTAYSVGGGRDNLGRLVISEYIGAGSYEGGKLRGTMIVPESVWVEIESKIAAQL